MLILAAILASITFKVPVVKDDIKLDGFLEPLWDSALVFSNFNVFEPSDREIPSFRTTLYVLQSDNSLYFAFKCEQDQIRSLVGLRDKGEGDYVGIYLDTFGKGSSVYFFGVNTAGVQTDRIITGGGKVVDYSWDGVWLSATRVSDGSYVVEMKIPFKTLQYDIKNPVFRMEATRFISKTNERLYIGKYKREWGLNPLDFPIELKLQLPESSFGFELMPVLLVQKDSANIKIKAGLDSKWCPSNKFTLNLTLYPDFSQVEADPFTLNLGKYEQYMEERRPFFVEGSEVFRFRSNPYSFGFGPSINPFYSRRIGKALSSEVVVPLIFGLKGFYKSRGFEGGLLTALTGDALYVYDSGDTLREEKALYNVISFRKQFSGNSNLGFIYSGKATKSNIAENHAIGVNFHYFVQSTELTGTFSSSLYENHIGNAFAFHVATLEETHHFMFSFMNIDSLYNVSEIGFTPWVGLRRLSILVGPNFEINGEKLQYASFSVGYNNKAEAFEGMKSQNFVFFHSSLNYRNGAGIEFHFSGGREYINNYVNTYEIDVDGWSSPNGRLELNGGIGFEKGYNYYRDYEGLMVSHRTRLKIHGDSRYDLELNLRGWLEFDPSSKLEEYTLSILPRFQYAVNKDLLVNIYGQYAKLILSKETESKKVNLLVSYNFKPKSWIYLVISKDFVPNSPLGKPLQGVFKIRYLFYF
jgi:hypothetical protein